MVQVSRVPVLVEASLNTMTEKCAIHCSGLPDTKECRMWTVALDVCWWLAYSVWWCHEGLFCVAHCHVGLWQIRGDDATVTRKHLVLPGEIGGDQGLTEWRSQRLTGSWFWSWFPTESQSAHVTPWAPVIETSSSRVPTGCWQGSPALHVLRPAVPLHFSFGATNQHSWCENPTSKCSHIWSFFFLHWPNTTNLEFPCHKSLLLCFLHIVLKNIA